MMLVRGLLLFMQKPNTVSLPPRVCWSLSRGAVLLSCIRCWTNMRQTILSRPRVCWTLLRGAGLLLSRRCWTNMRPAILSPRRVCWTLLRDAILSPFRGCCSNTREIILSPLRVCWTLLRGVISSPSGRWYEIWDKPFCHLRKCAGRFREAALCDSLDGAGEIWEKSFCRLREPLAQRGPFSEQTPVTRFFGGEHFLYCIYHCINWR